jgi:lipopolysaccharide export system protein LptA
MVEIRDSGDAVAMHFEKNAHMGAENFCLRGDSMDLLVNASDRHEAGPFNISTVNEIHFVGNATFEGKSHSGKADKISIYPPKKLLILNGRAEITDARGGTVRGEILTLDGENRRITAENAACLRSLISIDGIFPTESNNQHTGEE